MKFYYEVVIEYLESIIVLDDFNGPSINNMLKDEDYSTDKVIESNEEIFFSLDQAREYAKNNIEDIHHELKFGQIKSPTLLPPFAYLLTKYTRCEIHQVRELEDEDDIRKWIDLNEI